MMKYSINRDEEGRVVLQLGLSNAVSFDPDSSMEDVVMGVTVLIEQAVGVSTFELVKDVVQELGLDLNA